MIKIEDELSSGRNGRERKIWDCGWSSAGRERKGFRVQATLYIYSHIDDGCSA
jgi:hypothetical protein